MPSLNRTSTFSQNDLDCIESLIQKTRTRSFKLSEL